MLASPRSRLLRWGLVLAGIVIGQFILYGPSLVGSKILLPLDVLAQPDVYLPQTSGIAPRAPHDSMRSDIIYQFELRRCFVVAELQQGRFPRWEPYEFAGVPLGWPWFSPVFLFSCLTLSPLILAWTQLVAAVVAGCGAYAFFRRALGVGFWAAAIPAWCYPLTGFLVFWQGFPICGPVFWFPWVMLAVDRVVRRPEFSSLAGLSVATALVLSGGQLDVGGQALLAAGLFACWRVWDCHRARSFGSVARRTLAVLVVGWGLGIMLAAPHWLSLLDYAHTGARIERRVEGTEERPPVGLAALPPVVLPDFNGATRTGSLWLAAGNQIESSSAAYAGLIAMLFAAPLAWCSRRHRAFNVFCVVLAFLGLSWCLNVPGLVEVWRLPEINLMSHNRLVFWTSLAVLAQAAVGLEALQAGVSFRRWFAIPVGLLAVLGFWSLYRAIILPEPVATQLGDLVSHGNAVRWVHDAAGVREVQRWFGLANTVAAGWCLCGLAAWGVVLAGRGRRAWFIAAVGVLMVADMLWFAFGRSAQCDPAWYFPRIPALEQIARAPAGRVIGYGCLPATLAQAHGLRDIRGYDAIDPDRLMRLMDTVADPRSHRLSYAQTQWLLPRADIEFPDRVQLPPVLDLLDVRYFIFRGTPPPRVEPVFQSPDYSVLVNPRAVGRIFVPARVESVADEHEAFAKVTAASFDPRRLACVESPVSLPAEIRGSAVVARETPTQIVASVTMETPGLVILTDRWDKGWRAYLNGRRVPILHADYVLRGVAVPAGAATLEFRYEPGVFVVGLWLAGGAMASLAGLWIVERRRRGRTAGAGPAST
jgi:hypothetical protein